jgi:hypothetical protein
LSSTPVNDAEDADRGRGPECERAYGGQREAWLTPQQPRRDLASITMRRGAPVPPAKRQRVNWRSQRETNRRSSARGKRRRPLPATHVAIRRASRTGPARMPRESRPGRWSMSRLRPCRPRAAAAHETQVRQGGRQCPLPFRVIRNNRRGGRCSRCAVFRSSHDEPHVAVFLVPAERGIDRAARQALASMMSNPYSAPWSSACSTRSAANPQSAAHRMYPDDTYRSTT